MKTICMMTSEESFHNNYGAALQGYALYTTLKKLGYDPKIVRYFGNMQPKLSTYPLPTALRIIASRAYHSVKDGLAVTEKKKITAKYKKEIRQRERIFLDFQKYMSFYNDKRIGWYDLEKCPPIADIYVCGSDQIWNPYFRSQKNDLGYFMDFAPAGKPRIAYAPSFGCDSLPPNAKANIGELLGKFHGVSVREAAGQRIIKQEVGLDVPVVADPTLLLTSDDWAQIERPVVGMPEKYILCYRFSDNDTTKENIDKISQQTGLPVYTMPLAWHTLKDDYNKVFAAGPQEFIWLIRHATLVCTDSFHATVFSLICETPFCVFMRENFNASKANMNSRIDNLLKIAELSERLMLDLKDVDINTIFEVDFSKFKNNIKELREESLEWLSDRLSTATSSQASK